MQYEKVITFSLLIIACTATKASVPPSRGWAPANSEFARRDQIGYVIPRVTINKSGKEITPEIAGFVMSDVSRPFVLTKDGNILRLSNEGEWEDITKVISDASIKSGHTPSKFKQIYSFGSYVLVIDANGQIYKWEDGPQKRR